MKNFYEKVIKLAVATDYKGQSVEQYLVRGPEHFESPIENDVALVGDIGKNKVADFGKAYECFNYYVYKEGYEESLAWDECGCHVLPIELQMQLRRKIEEDNQKMTQSSSYINDVFKISKKVSFDDKIKNLISFGINEKIINHIVANSDVIEKKEVDKKPKNKYMKRKVCIIGFPNESRDEICKKISSFYGVESFGINDLIKKAIETGIVDENEGKVNDKELSPENVELIFNMISNMLDGYVINGYPISLSNIDTINADAIIFIDDDIEEIVKTQKDKRWCPVCQMMYHLSLRPPIHDEKICDRCGTNLTTREEDIPLNIRTRYYDWRSSFNNMMKHLKKRKNFLSIKKVNKIEEIAEQINDFINNIIKENEKEAEK
jgi:adenylate kinase